jgi:hypothetical protein
MFSAPTSLSTNGAYRASTSPSSTIAAPFSLRVLAMSALLAFGASLFAQSPVVIPGSTAVKQSATAVTVTVTMTAAGLSDAPRALTLGADQMDYSIVASTDTKACAANVTYNKGDQCTVNVVFTPLYPGQRPGAVVISSGNDTILLGETLLAGQATGSLAVEVPGLMNTVAGDVLWTYQGDGVLATDASIFLPTGVVVDAAGNIIISDSSNNRVRRVQKSNGMISTLAGNGTPAYSVDGLKAFDSTVNGPSGLALDGAANIYFADTGNDVIRRIDAVSGVMTTVAGIGGMQGYAGDNGLATAAKLSMPEAIAFDSAQNLYIADTGNNVIRKVDAISGVITTYAGTGLAGYKDGIAATTALLSKPWGLAIGTDNTLYIADMGNDRVRHVDANGTINTVVGNGTGGFSGDGGAPLAAEIDEPAGIAFDPAGDLYIADSGNDRIRELPVATPNMPNPNITTIAGTGEEQFDGDGGPANQAQLYGPYALFFDQRGNLFMTDMFHNRIRKISAFGLSFTYPEMRVGKISSMAAEEAEAIENVGNTNLTLAAPTLHNTALDPQTTTCNVGTVLTLGDSCNLGIEFAPQATGNPAHGFVKINSDAANTPDFIKVSGVVLSVNPTSTLLASSENPSLVGDSVTFTATINGGGASLTGAVTFTDGNLTLCTSSLNANGVATCMTKFTQLGTHSITASYAGDSDDAASVSTVLMQVVKQASAIVLSSAPNPSVVTGAVQLTAVVSVPTGNATGSITFNDAGSAIGSASIDGTGTAVFTARQLNVGTHNISAQYVGDGTNGGSTSNTVSQVVSQASTLTTLKVSESTVNVGVMITFTATVTSANGPTPNAGTVQFMDGTTVLNSNSVDANGVATLTIGTLAPGVHNITAIYSNSANEAPDASSTSSLLVETVNQLGTITTLSSTSNPANAGASGQIIANVAIMPGEATDGTITGTVTFSVGLTTLGKVPVDANGNASLPLASLPVNANTIVAVYAGNTNYAGSTSSSFTETITATSTTTTLISSNPSAYEGKQVTFTATVTSGTGIPTKLVTFFSNGTTNLGNVALDGNGIAKLTLATLPAATQQITAVYEGDDNYTKSMSIPVQEVISQAVPIVTLTGPAAPVNPNVAVTLTGTIGSPGVTPTGALTLMDGLNSIVAQNATAGGSFTFSTSSLAIGSHKLMVAYAGDVGDTDNAAANSNVVLVVVQQASTTTSLSSNVNPQILGQSVTFSANVSSVSPGASGAIAFMDGGNSLGSVPIDANGNAALTTKSLAFGSHTITAVYSSDTNHAASTSAAIAELIVQAAGATLLSSQNPSVAGTNVIFTMKLTGVGSVIPTGSVAFSDGGNSIGTVAVDATGTAMMQTSTLSVASHDITASYAGDKSYAASTASLTQTVQNADTQVKLTSTASPATYLAPASFIATITSNGSAATGSVAFTDGTTPIGSALLNAQGVATLTLSSLAPGTHSIVANYSGNGKAAGSVSNPLSFVVKEATTVSVASNSDPSPTLSPVLLTATVVNSGVGTLSGNVTFTDAGTQLGVVAVAANGVASLTVPALSAGSHSIIASYTGDDNDFASVSMPMVEVVSLRPTTTTLTASETNVNNAEQVTLISVERWTGTTAPTGSVTFMNGSTVIGSSPVDGTGVATLTIVLQAPSVSFTAVYAGDAAYASSTSPSVSVSGGQPIDFTLTLNPSTMTLKSQQHSVSTLTINSFQNFADMIQLGCVGLPTAASCTFSTTQSKLTAGGTTTVTITVDTGDPLGSGAESASLEKRSNGVMLGFLPVGLLASLALMRKRRKSLLGLLLVVCAIMASLGVTGCGGLSVNGTPVGNYTFKVTAVGQQSGISATQVMTLNVTK